MTTIRDYVKAECIDTDIQNFVDTGLRTEEEVRAYYDEELKKIYKDKADMTLLKIYDEYYGIETLLDKQAKTSMKVWYLGRESLDYAIVLADTLDEAFEKAEKRTGFKKEDWNTYEEFKPGMYGDVIWFN